MAETDEELKGQDLVEAVERDYMKSRVPSFRVGDSLDVALKIREGGRERTQVFSGTCIARKGGGGRETFTVRRIVGGEGVERIFPLHSPNIESIQVTRRGRARRAKLHYLRQRTGRASRLREDLRARAEEEAEESEQ